MGERIIQRLKEEVQLLGNIPFGVLNRGVLNFYVKDAFIIIFLNHSIFFLPSLL